MINLAVKEPSADEIIYPTRVSEINKRAEEMVEYISTRTKVIVKLNGVINCLNKTPKGLKEATETTLDIYKEKILNHIEKFDDKGNPRIQKVNQLSYENMLAFISDKKITDIGRMSPIKGPKTIEGEKNNPVQKPDKPDIVGFKENIPVVSQVSRSNSTKLSPEQTQSIEEIRKSIEPILEDYFTLFDRLQNASDNWGNFSIGELRGPYMKYDGRISHIKSKLRGNMNTSEIKAYEGEIIDAEASLMLGFLHTYHNYISYKYGSKLDTQMEKDNKVWSRIDAIPTDANIKKYLFDSRLVLGKSTDIINSATTKKQFITTISALLNFDNQRSAFRAGYISELQERVKKAKEEKEKKKK